MSAGPARLVAAVAHQRHGLIGLAVTRVALGVVILLDLAIHVGDRQVLYGPDGWYGVDRMERDQQLGVSLFNLSSSAWATDVLYLAYAVVAALFVAGWRTRVLTPLLLLLVWTFQERNPYLINGGDNLVRIILFYLLFAQLDSYLSRGASARRTRPRGEPTSAGIVANVVHNAALAACVGQLCVLYLGSALYKVQGEMWQEGTAVYYISRVAEYNAWPEVTFALAQSATFVTVATYATVFLQLAFTFTLFTPWARHAVFAGLVGMHAGIGVLMGLPVFSLFMIAVDLLVFTDDEWRRGAARVGRVADRLRAGGLASWSRHLTPAPATPAPPGGVL